MERLKQVIEMLETSIEKLKNDDITDASRLDCLLKQLETPYEQVARDLHEDNLISADTLFTVSRNLDQLRELMVAGTEDLVSVEVAEKLSALIEHKLELLRLNFINASNNLDRTRSNTA